MQITDKVLNILQSISGIKTVIHDNAFSTNVRLDRRLTPAAILFMLQEFTVNIKSGLRRDSVELEVLICDRVDLAAKGEVVDNTLNNLLPIVNDFIALVLDEKSWVVEGDTINIKVAYGKFDTNVCGYSIELKLTEKQGHCLEYTPPTPPPIQGVQGVQGIQNA